MIYHGQQIYARHVILATTLFARMRGLLGRKSLGAETAMVIDPCSSIHTLGMKFALDVVFLDSKNKITAIARAVKPGRFWVSGGWSCRRVVESEAGCLDLSRLHIGDMLEMKKALQQT
jgi:uncharacterized membrane protein (UPF0127 family)